MDETQIIELFCLVDSFVKQFDQIGSQEYLAYKKKKIRKRSCRTSLSEVMTILLLFHRSNYRTFKHFYLNQVKVQWDYLFPNLVKYSRFIQLTSHAFFPMFCFLKQHQGAWGDLQFIDSTVLTSCHVKRASSHKTFRSSARWGKTTTGWFFGFKLHLVINQQAEIVAFRLTAGNIDDRTPVPEMVRPMRGKLFGDRGYISEKLRSKLLKNGTLLITKLKRNMKNKLMDIYDKIMLRKRALIESVHNLLKSSCQIEHHRHRSPWNFLSNLFSGMAIYCLNPNKPRLHFPKEELEKLRSLECFSIGLR
jgi:hypothetical protein